MDFDVQLLIKSPGKTRETVITIDRLYQDEVSSAISPLIGTQGLKDEMPFHVDSPAFIAFLKLIHGMRGVIRLYDDCDELSMCHKYHDAIKLDEALYHAVCIAESIEGNKNCTMRLVW